MPGVVAEHEPSHWMVPELVWPQAFGADVQVAPSLGAQVGADEPQAGTPMPAPVMLVQLICSVAGGVEVEEKRTMARPASSANARTAPAPTDMCSLLPRPRRRADLSRMQSL